MQNQQVIPPELRETMTNVIVWMATSRRVIDEVIDQMPLYLLQKTQAGAQLAALVVRLQKVIDDKPGYRPDLSHAEQTQELGRHCEAPRIALEDAQKTIKAALKQTMRQRAKARLWLLERDIAETLTMYPFKREAER